MMKYGLVKSFVFLFVVSGQLYGCAKADETSTDTISKLQREVLQLKAENANLYAKNHALDDKLLVVEKKIDVKQGEHRIAKLKTVKLTPSLGEPVPFESNNDQIAEEISFADKSHAEHNRISHKKRKHDKKRPVLKLSGNYDLGTSNSSYHSSRRSPSIKKASAVNYRDIPVVGKGDNLGVVGGASRDVSSLPAANSSSSSMDVFNSAYRAYNNGNMDSALAGFAQFLKMEPSHSYSDNAMFWRGESYLASGHTIKAIGEFERLLRRFPNSEKAASALYRIGFIFDQLNDKQKAGKYYFKVVESYPGSAAARKAGKRMAMQSRSGTIERTSLKR